MHHEGEKKQKTNIPVYKSVLDYIFLGDLFYKIWEQEQMFLLERQIIMMID